MIQVSRRSIIVLLRRVLLVWATEVLGLWLLARALPGLAVDSVTTAVWAVAVIALLNAIVRPLLLALTLPFTVLSFGLLTLVLNALIIVLAGQMVGGFHVSDIGTAMIAALGLAVINTLITSVLAFHDEDSVYRNIVLRIARRGAPRPAPQDPVKPGLMVIEIDGLSTVVLKEAISRGYMPTLARWLRNGSHRLTGWDCGLPSQTSSSQAGILCGNNFDIPAFRWYEKERAKLMVSNNLRDATEIERRVSNGEGLLRNGGYSLGNLISGDATRCVLTMSTAMDPARCVREGYNSFFFALVDPYHISRAFVLSLADIMVELVEAFVQRIAAVRPRVRRGGSFPLLRAASTVFMRELNVSLLMAEMFSGAPVIYATFVGYDVVAHQAGPARHDSLRQLRAIDRRIALLARAAEDAPRPYYFVILSDHGQSSGATFKQRYDMTLEELVQSLLTGDERVSAYVGTGESWGYVNALLSEAARYEGVTGRAMRRMFKRRTRDGYVELGPPTEPEKPEEPARVLVCASGNLGLLYFADRPGRMPFEEIARDYPRLIEGLLSHPGIGFLMANSERYGPLVLGRTGVHYLKDGRVEGGDPLAGFGERAAEHLRRIDGFPHTGDLLVNSVCDPKTGEVPAFEEEVGSHGGLGGPQTDAFLLYPTAWGDGDLELRTSVDIYWFLRRHYEQL